MHELGIIENILKEAENIAAANSLDNITGIKLKIGKLRHVVPEMLSFSFDAVKAGTIVEGATLTIDYVPVVAYCRNCKLEFEVEDNNFSCKKCDGFDLELLSGKEIMLESIDGEKK